MSLRNLKLIEYFLLVHFLFWTFQTSYKWQKNLKVKKISEGYFLLNKLNTFVGSKDSQKYNWALLIIYKKLILEYISPVCRLRVKATSKNKLEQFFFILKFEWSFSKNIPTLLMKVAAKYIQEKIIFLSAFLFW